ncbi:MAG: polysaccharide biosynthesis/export family protein [Lentisphaeria bacterium]
MKFKNVCLSAFLVSMITGCQTTESSEAFAPTFAENPSAKVTNGQMAELMVRMLGEDAMVKNRGDVTAYIAQLQRSGRWPKGAIDPNAEFNQVALQAVRNNIMAKSVEGIGRDMTIEPEATITVRIHGVGSEDSSHEVKVSRSGEVTLPMIGLINVARLTPIEAAAKIRNTYIEKRFYNNLIVDVTGETGSVFISGEIKTPGAITYKAGMTLSDLVIQAGDVTQFAKREVTLNRNKVTSKHDLDKILKGIESDPVLKPGDRVIAHQRTF